jgi:Rab GDP dissociation inhibitor
MDQEYDVIALGTGLKECILSGLLSVSKRTVLHMDRNNYYGGESASLNLEQLWAKFKPEEKVLARAASARLCGCVGGACSVSERVRVRVQVPTKEQGYGRSRDWNVDLCPKFIMARGNLVKMLLHTKVTRYLEFRSVMGSFVFQDNAIHKVPSTPSEALSSGLLSGFQKIRFRQFVVYVHNLEQANPKTWEGKDASKETALEIFKYWKLDDPAIIFTGHALALHQNDDYLNKPALPTLQAMKLYADSVASYGNSPYIYPIYGLGGLPEGFSRLSAIHGGVYMLNRPIEEILYDAAGHVTGVKSQGETARCKQLLADPSYFMGTDKVRSVGKVARCICILSHPIPNTNNADSCQIILPFHQLRRRHDLYVFCVSSVHQVCPEGKWVAVVSTEVETKDPHSELIPALKLMGPIDKEFFWVSERFEPVRDFSKEGIFITTSYDATSHFEAATVEVMDIYKRMTGKDVDLSAPADEPEQSAE